VLSSEIVCISGYYNMLRVYKVHGCQLHLLATLPNKGGMYMASCVHHAGYVLASAPAHRDIRISVTSRFNRDWVQKVVKIVLNSTVLPFCRDVHKIIFRYL